MENTQTSNNQYVSFEDIKMLFRETDKKFQETDKKFQETREELRYKSLETDKKFQETREELRIKSLETEKMFRETEKMFQETSKETSKELKTLKDMIYGIGYNNGDVAEDFFYNGFSATMQVGEVHYDFIDRNRERRKNRLESEYDIILINADKLLVVEVKNKLHPNDVIKFAEKKLTSFKELFPEYKSYTIYGAVATLALPDDSYKLAIKYGLQIFTQSGESIKNVTPQGLECSTF